jgi:probable phosphoglycerate mutase
VAIVNAYFCGQNNSKLTSKKIYIVRHGQTDFNLQNIVQGSGVDSSLNNRGRDQAAAFFEKYKGVAFDKIYTSRLRRTTESVQSFIDLGIPTEALAGLNEISWGNKEGYKITATEDEYYHNMLREWQLGNTSHRIEGGESPDDVVRRMQPAIDHILSRQDENTVLICMHGRAIRIILCILLRYPLKSMDMFEHENLGLYLLNYNGSFFSLDLYNDSSHLTPS